MNIRDFLRRYRIEIFIFGLAIAARFLYFGFSLASDDFRLIETISGADCYYSISQNIVAGNGYSCSPEAPYELNSMRPPVYPYFLAWSAKLLNGYEGPLALQILIGGLVPLLGMAIARRLRVAGAVVFSAGIVLALEPYSILFSTFFYPETMFTVFLLSAILLALRYYERPHPALFAASGALLGLATLCKPTAQFLPLLLVAVAAWHFRRELRRHAMALLLCAGAFVLIVSPWALRNYAQFGIIGISPQTGEQLYVMLVPSVLAIENGTGFEEEYQAHLRRGAVDPNKASIADSGEYLRAAVPMLLEHPKGLVLISANTALNFFIHDGMLEVLKHLELDPQWRLEKPALFLLLSDPVKIFAVIRTVLFTPVILILVGRLIWILITAAFIAGVVRYVRREGATPHILTISGVVAYFMLTTLVIGLAVAARYRLPVNALIIPLALYEMSFWLAAGKDRLARVRARLSV